MNSLVELARKGFDIEIKTEPDTKILMVKIQKEKHWAVSSVDAFDQIVACAYESPDFLLYQVIDKLLDKYFCDEEEKKDDQTRS